MPVISPVAPRTVAAWVLPGAMVATALVVRGHWFVAVGIGLAAGLSLSGSV
jgi:hypothetical protein